jgi:uncharacterized membrane protein
MKKSKKKSEGKGKGKGKGKEKSKEKGKGKGKGHDNVFDHDECTDKGKGKGKGKGQVINYEDDDNANPEVMYTSAPLPASLPTPLPDFSSGDKGNPNDDNNNDDGEGSVHIGDIETVAPSPFTNNSGYLPGDNGILYSNSNADYAATSNSSSSGDDISTGKTVGYSILFLVACVVGVACGFVIWKQHRSTPPRSVQIQKTPMVIRGLITDGTTQGASSSEQEELTGNFRNEI